MSTRAIPLLDGYDFVNRLGRGAGAIISAAVERTTGRRVAIKHVVRRTADEDKFVAQAETEFEVARRFEHPALRRCYDIFRVRRWLTTRELFLVMEYVDGEPLEERCPNPDRLERILPLFVQIAEGLHALHGYGFAHADIKPNNILLARGGGVKIIDFGQSCPLGHKKERIQGTPDYMAPEQIERRKIDHRTDVFNLGATMYWVLTGKFFKTNISTAPTGTKKIEIDARSDSVPPHEVNPRVPLPLSRLIMDCCEPNREQRPADMREVISRLEVVHHVLARRGLPAARPGRRGGRVPRHS